MPALWRTQANRLQALAVEVCWRPAQGETSGDFYELIDLRDGRAAVVLGDAPASGPAAAELAEELRFELRRAFRTTDRPVEALRHLDERLARRGPDTIATAVCALLDQRAGVAEVTNAGHLPIVLADGTQARFLDGRSDPPLGVAAERRSVQHSLAGESALFMFTDGLVERRDRPLDQGLDAVLAAARGLTGAAAWASELARRATSSLGQPTDDATVVSVNLRPSWSTVSSPSGGRLALRLYVDPDDLRSNRAEVVVRDMARRLHGLLEVDLEVVDIAAAAGLAERDGVMAAPTVVRLLPPPVVRVVGGLRSAAELARTLQLPYPEDGE